MKDKLLNTQPKFSIRNSFNLKNKIEDSNKRFSSRLENIFLNKFEKSTDSQSKILNFELSQNFKDLQNLSNNNNSPLIFNGDILMTSSDIKNSNASRDKNAVNTELRSQLTRKISTTPSNDLNKITNYSRKASSKFNNNPLYFIIEKIQSITSIKNKIIEDYTKISFKPTADGKRDIINQWKKVLEISLNLDPILFINSLKCLGDIYLEFDNYESAKHFYYNYKFFSFYMELLDDLIIAYESLGNVYKFLFQYHKAIKCYKKQIEIAWVINNKNAELRGYDNIGIQYFYLGNKEKAKYYHERMIYGRVESQQSDMKEIVLRNYRNKNFYLFNDEKFLKINKTNEELRRKLRDALSLFEDERDVNLENFDIFKNQENMKNSFISDVDMSFTIIPEKYLKDEFDVNSTFLPSIQKLRNGKKKNKDARNYNFLKNNSHKKISFNELDTKHENHHVNNMILSHLSTKRKDFNTDRFRKIFERFDKILNDFKKNIL